MILLTAMHLCTQKSQGREREAAQSGAPPLNKNTYQQCGNRPPPRHWPAAPTRPAPRQQPPRPAILHVDLHRHSRTVLCGECIVGPPIIPTNDTHDVQRRRRWAVAAGQRRRAGRRCRRARPLSPAAVQLRRGRTVPSVSAGRASLLRSLCATTRALDVAAAAARSTARGAEAAAQLHRPHRYGHPQLAGAQTSALRYLPAHPRQLPVLSHARARLAEFDQAQSLPERLFRKSGPVGQRQGTLLAIHPANVEDFRKGDFRRRKAQRKVRKHMGLAVDDDGEDSPSSPPQSPPPTTLPALPFWGSAAARLGTSTVAARKRQFDVASLLAPDDAEAPGEKNARHPPAPPSDEEPEEDIDVVTSDQEREPEPEQEQEQEEESPRGPLLGWGVWPLQPALLHQLRRHAPPPAHRPPDT
ncbi:hypothetical protein EVAR_22152_1 [Eumeta japonica]|uniref:Uncharacterized protein n=1 Tax=Eumeta variegata TaxID=151549 RepID=A0A4C1VZ05_EUMVA|nr:hypothetical protein EVAR_22152_1 [Eumeta japonica]